MPKQKITPFLWFNTQAQEAVNFYLSIFKDAKIINTTRYGEAGAEISRMVKGSIMTIAFELYGQEFIALNGGPQFKFTEAISFIINCDTQEEIDELWEKLSEGGEKGPCGWLKDKYGFSWQVVPSMLDAMLQDENPEKSERVMSAILQMGKFDIKKLQEAYQTG